MKGNEVTAFVCMQAAPFRATSACLLSSYVSGLQKKKENYVLGARFFLQPAFHSRQFLPRFAIDSPIAMDTREWFDEGTYSDLTIKLSDGTDIKVHKVIICRMNEYFRKLCGPGSRFAVSCITSDVSVCNANVVDQESRQAAIELKDDDPLALNHVLRYIYKLPILSDAVLDLTWRGWLNLRTTADKYLEPTLSAQADKNFRTVALKITDPDEIFDITETIDNEMAHDESLVELSNKIRKNNWSKLLRNIRFRAKLERGGTEALWQVINDLAFAADLEEKRLFVCELHEDQVFDIPSERQRDHRTLPCLSSTIFGTGNRAFQRLFRKL